MIDPGLPTRFAVPLDEGVKFSSEYSRFVATNEEATRLCVAMQDKTRITLQSRHPQVVASQGRVEDALLALCVSQLRRDVEY